MEKSELMDAINKAISTKIDLKLTEFKFLSSELEKTTAEFNSEKDFAQKKAKYHHLMGILKGLVTEVSYLEQDLASILSTSAYQEVAKQATIIENTDDVFNFGPKKNRFDNN